MSSTYRGDYATGSYAVAHAHSHQALVVWVFSSPHQHLMAHEVGLLIDHEEATLHPAGVTPAKVGRQLWAVTAGFIGATLEVPVFIENDLQKRKTSEVCVNKQPVNSYFAYLFL